jgi:DNA polymerase-3 subunit delta'
VIELLGQEAAAAQLRAAATSPVHAYLFVGPDGVGKRAAARQFAAALLCPAAAGAEHDPGCEVCRRVGDGVHPDVLVYEREGARLSVGDAREITRLALRSPIEAARKVIVIPDLDLAAQIAPALLKTLEEPPPGVVFVGLAEHVPPELVTIASRCVRIDFRPLPMGVIAAALGAEGVEPNRAVEVAAAANGSMSRARLLAGDPGFVARRALWAGAPERLDGTGSAVAIVTTELLASIEELLAPLQARQAEELTELETRAERYGERGSGRKELLDRHKREQRRLRMDELRAGLATLAGVYRDRLTQGAHGRHGVHGTHGGPGAHGRSARAALDALDALAAANDALERNPNETLLVQSLLVRLTDAGVAA